MLSIAIAEPMSFKLSGSYYGRRGNLDYHYLNGSFSLSKYGHVQLGGLSLPDTEFLFAADRAKSTYDDEPYEDDGGAILLVDLFANQKFSPFIFAEWEFDSLYALDSRINFGAGGKYLPEDADWPEEQPEDDRQWLHINGVTGRATACKSDKIIPSGYNVYITHSPILPSELQRELRAICAGFDHANSYQPNWLDSSPPWVPAGNHYPIPGGRNEKLNPIFKNIPYNKAVELRGELMNLGRYANQGGILVGIAKSIE